MNEKNKQKRFVMTPDGKGWLDEYTHTVWIVILSDPKPPLHKGARMSYYPEQIKEIDEEHDRELLREQKAELKKQSKDPDDKDFE